MIFNDTFLGNLDFSMNFKNKKFKILPTINFKFYQSNIMKSTILNFKKNYKIYHYKIFIILK